MLILRPTRPPVSATGREAPGPRPRYTPKWVPDRLSGAARMEIETVTVGQDGGERASRLTAIRPNNP
nr:hypothetical protein GCM10020092_028480 [Actinoplanes digitatis]